jgi:hypothetical protein
MATPSGSSALPAGDSEHELQDKANPAAGTATDEAKDDIRAVDATNNEEAKKSEPDKVDDGDVANRNQADGAGDAVEEDDKEDEDEEDE